MQTHEHFMIHRMLKFILKTTKHHENIGSLIFGGVAFFIAVIFGVWILLSRVPIATLSQKIEMYMKAPIASTWGNAIKTLELRIESMKKVPVGTQSGTYSIVRPLRTHRTITSDTLWKLAVRYYNDGYRWTKIYEANKKLIPDPNTLDKDITLVIPE